MRQTESTKGPKDKKKAKSFHKDCPKMKREGKDSRQ